MNSKLIKLIVVLVLLVFVTSVFSTDKIHIEINNHKRYYEWKIPGIVNGQKISNYAIFKNRLPNKTAIRLIPDCDCLSVDKNIIEIDAGKSGNVKLTFDSTDYSETFAHYFIVTALDNSFPVKKIRVFGYVKNKPKIQLFVSPGCKKCKYLKDVLFPNLFKKYNISPDRLNVLDTSDPETLEYLLTIEKKVNAQSKSFPTVYINNKLISGMKAIQEQIEYEISIIDKIKQQIEIKLVDKKVSFNDISLVPVMISGLIDGINPCAFATIVFLISYLTFYDKTKRDILVIGTLYTISVFLSYLLIGLFFLKVLQELTIFNYVNTIIEYFSYILLSVLSILSFYDAFLAYKGKTSEITLQLPNSFKKRIHRHIRIQFGNKTLIFSTIIIGVLVSSFELICTGQIYLPIVLYMVKQSTFFIKGIFYLLLYNLMFILPLIIVFILTYIGWTSEKIGNILKKHLFIIKILLGLVFLSLLILMIKF